MSFFSGNTTILIHTQWAAILLTYWPGKIIDCLVKRLDGFA